jgi:hypothetical protein
MLLASWSRPQHSNDRADWTARRHNFETIVSVDNVWFELNILIGYLPVTLIDFVQELTLASRPFFFRLFVNFKVGPL